MKSWNSVLGRHPRERGDPGGDGFWIPACVGMTLATVLPVQAQNWQIHDVASEGGKPTLALDENGIPHIVYMREAADGYLRLAVWNAAADSFDIEPVVDGYFFGPAAMTIDSGGHPHVNYHDHATGNQQHVYENDQGWVNEPISSPGHDGWDNSIVIDARGVVHTSSIDPTAAGVEYAYSTSTGWVVEAIGSNRINYGYGTSLAVDPLGIPHIAYFDNFTEDLMVASRTSGWVISAADTAGDVGRFPSLQVDGDGGLHVSYYRDLGSAGGTVEYAYFDGADWSFSTVDKLDNLLASVAGYITSLDLDSNGDPHVAYGDQKVVKYAYREEDQWMRWFVTDARRTTKELGQLVSMNVDKAGVPHLTYYELISRGPLNGIVKYARRENAPVSAEANVLPQLDPALEIYPNPAGTRTQVSLVLHRPSGVSLAVYNVLGRAVRRMEIEHRSPGRYSLQIDTGSLAGGLYIVSLRAEGRSIQRSLLVQN